ncbi:MAG: hypothetical protein K6A70_01905 [Erysipelotrichaceae bacterium]|nr:hypothetical protein [Erysipelotrichaceae bacterium]
MINLSDELKEKLDACKSDVEVAKMLSDNGIDMEEFEKTLPKEVLNKIGGGYTDFMDVDVYCPHCHNEDKEEISYQVLASLGSLRSKYRCCKCGGYFAKTDTGQMKAISK